MASLNDPSPNNHTPQGGDGTAKLLNALGKSVHALISAISDSSAKDDVSNAAREFSGVAVEALEKRVLSPDDVLRSLRLKNPQTGGYVLLEQGRLVQLLLAVCRSVKEQISQGKPVSSETLKQLGAFAASPHIAGVPGSLEAYRAMMLGATHFYEVSGEMEDAELPRFDSTRLLATFMSDLHRVAQPHPYLVANVIRFLGQIPVDGPLLDALDSCLWNTAHPSRTTVPALVREAATHAIADRVHRPPIRIKCDESFGVIDRHSAFELFVTILQCCPEREAARAVIHRLDDMLGEEITSMLRAKEGLAQSSFHRREKGYRTSEAVRGLGARVEEIFRGSPEELPRKRDFERVLHAARDVDVGLGVYRASELVSSFAPAFFRERIRAAFHWGYRFVDRVKRGGAPSLI